MQGEDRARGWVEQRAAGHQVAPGRYDLLTGLEDKAHRAAQLGPQPTEDHGRAQEHRRVAVVAAGVHQPGVLRLVGQPGLLLQGQRVHVGPQRDVGPGLRSRKQCDRVGAQQGFAQWQTQRQQGCPDQGGGLVFLQRQLGVPVQSLADLGDLGQYLCHQLGQAPVEVLDGCHTALASLIAPPSDAAVPAGLLPG